jgi:hypothetical protein
MQAILEPPPADKQMKRTAKQASRLLRVLHKLRYFVCWAATQDAGVFEALAVALETARSEHEAFLRSRGNGHARPGTGAVEPKGADTGDEAALKAQMELLALD